MCCTHSVGGGPAHAAELARQLHIKEVVVPPVPGLFSSLGLLFSDVEHHYVQTLWRDVPQGLDYDEVNGILEALEREAMATLMKERFTEDNVHLIWQADMRYQGQGYELPVPLLESSLTPDGVKHLEERFHEEHNRTFGYRSHEQVQLVNLRLIARGLPAEPRMPNDLVSDPVAVTNPFRQAYFGPAHGWLDTAVISREDLLFEPRRGPIIVEEYDSTTVVPPEVTARRDEWGNILITVDGSEE